MCSGQCLDVVNSPYKADAYIIITIWEVEKKEEKNPLLGKEMRQMGMFHMLPYF